MKDDQRLSVEVEFIRQTSFLRTALRSWLLARVSHPIAATRIADLYKRNSRLLAGFALSSPFGSRRLRNLLESVAGQILISNMNRYITQAYDTDKTVVAA